MLFLKVNLKKDISIEIKAIVSALKKGKVLVLPTDTIYGLSCLASNEEAIKRIKKLKGNDKNKPLSILVSGIEMLKKYSYVSVNQEKKIKEIWNLKKRPTTIILKHRHKLPVVLTGVSDGIAARLPKLDFLIKILEELKSPIVSTSLNLTGESVVDNPKVLSNYFPLSSGKPDLIIDAGKCSRHKASQIIDLREDSKLVILRK
jgi:L-threonylcarbamoyladenylate synthase